MDRIKNKHIRGTARLDVFVTKEKARSRWFGHLKRRSRDPGRRMLEMELLGRRKTKEKISGCGERRYAAERCRRKGKMETNDLLWKLLKGKGERGRS